MNQNDDHEHADTERLLRRVRPTEPSTQLKALVLQTAREAWPGASTNIPWQIPIRRLALSAVAATVLISLANLYADHASGHEPAAIPIAEHVEPCDPEVMTVPNASSIRYVVTTVRSIPTDASILSNHLEEVRETLGATERDEKSDGPDPIERRSRLHQIPSSLNS